MKFVYLCTFFFISTATLASEANIRFQEQLNRLGYNVGAADGILGKKSKLVLHERFKSNPWIDTTYNCNGTLYFVSQISDLKLEYNIQ